MFGYVPQKDFDDEREKRIRAEALAEERLTTILRLQEAQSQSYSNRERELSLVLEHLKPTPAAETPAGPFTGGMEHLSSSQLLSIPAIGRRGLAERQRAIAAAIEREKGESSSEDAATRREALTEEEAALVDRSLEAQTNAT